MTRLIILIALTAVAVGVALLLQRRRPEAPTAPSYRAPTQVDRADFDHDSTPTLLAVFTSASCSSCATAWSSVESLAATQDGLAAQRIEIQDDPKLHQRYRIDGVPTTLIIDADGVVTKSFFGPPVEDDLLAALP